mgnify:CR=1 FL=1
MDRGLPGRAPCALGRFSLRGVRRGDGNRAGGMARGGLRRAGWSRMGSGGFRWPESGRLARRGSGIYLLPEGAPVGLRR